MKNVHVEMQHFPFRFVIFVAVLVMGAQTGAEVADRTMAQSTPTAFVHPGVLHTAADLQRVKKMIARGAQPWKSGFDKLREHSQSQATWRVRGPFATVRRDPRGSQHIAELEADSNAAYQNALMWCLTGQEAHARKAVQILDSWAGTLREISGHDKELAASLCGFKLVNAAELMRHTDPGWPAQDIRQFEQFLRAVLYPVVKDFATFANGNWDTGCLKTMMAMGVFLDDRAMFERARDYYLGGAGNGCLTNYVINVAGQCQESGRDQQHAQLGLGHLADACEMAWHQGLDLYGAADNRLLRGFEYTAQYNLGLEVPFTPYTDLTGKNQAKVISRQGRGGLRPLYEMIWNHYEKRRSVPAPFTARAAASIRPEGPAKGADHPGFGTLLFTLPAPEPGAAGVRP